MSSRNAGVINKKNGIQVVVNNLPNKIHCTHMNALSLSFLFSFSMIMTAQIEEALQL